MTARMFKTAYGNTLEVTIYSTDDTVKDVSSFTGFALIVDKPNISTATRFTMSKKTDGTDGVVKYTFANGDVNTVGQWRCMVELTKSGTKLFTEPFSIIVESIIE